MAELEDMGRWFELEEAGTAMRALYQLSKPL